MPPSSPKFKHLQIKDTAHAQPFKQRTPPVRAKPLPPRVRDQHGSRLKDQLEKAKQDALARRHQGEQEVRALGIPVADGMYLEFDLAANQEQALQRLESDSQGIELIAVHPVTKPSGTSTIRATVFVPRGKLAHFEKRIKQYLEEDTNKGKPKHETLIASIEDIRLATMNALWTEAEKQLPSSEEALWWEVWLRKTDAETHAAFQRAAEQLGIRIDPLSLTFPDRRVVLAHGTRAQISKSVEFLDLIAELRLAKELASSFTSMTAREQADWRDDLLARVVRPQANAPAVCLLDTGVNHQHPLLALALDAADLHAYEKAWKVSDHAGHGTQMAGIALYGDLTSALSSQRSVTLEHLLESVKILPPPPGANDPKLYGAITLAAIGLAEVQAPMRARAVCMTVTSTDARDRGQPSSWSAEVDQICSGAQDDSQRLLIVSAGNTDLDARSHYPDSNVSDGIHDPGQAWNALTVGACTYLGHIDHATHPGWQPLAESGTLSPSSSTSCTWDGKKWPIKPDIVMEGGNMARSPDGRVDYVDSLQLLTTHHHPMVKSFVVTGDTSAAAAHAARLAALLHAQYPAYRPETVRALLVHSADWTPAMERQCPLTQKRQASLTRRLQHYGFGVPNLERALWCANNLLTMVAQDELQPFEERTTNDFGSKEMNLHHLPWPKAELQALGATQVELRVTLSYFVDPSPGRRGWLYRHRYASHGLRFDIKTASESEAEFRRRINAAAELEDDTGTRTRSDASQWLLGPQLRHRGSIHSDRWTGTAADLAEREFLAVYPVIGWWRERPQLNRGNKRARYALVVSIHTPETSVDIYTPVMQQIQTKLQVALST